MSDQSKIFVPMSKSYQMPFFYNSISVLWIFYPADLDVLAGYLEGTGLRPATFNYAVPSPNDADAATWNYTVFQPPGDPCYDPPPDGKGLCEGDPCYPLFVSNPSNQPAEGQPFLYKTSADFRHLDPSVGNASPLRLYSMFPGGPGWQPGDGGQKLIASLWNLLGTFATYFPLESGVDLEYGTGDFAMRADMEAIVGAPPHDALAARVFQSPPQAVQNRAIFVNP